MTAIAQQLVGVRPDGVESGDVDVSGGGIGGDAFWKSHAGRQRGEIDKRVVPAHLRPRRIRSETQYQGETGNQRSAHSSSDILSLAVECRRHCGAERVWSRGKLCVNNGPPRGVLAAGFLPSLLLVSDVSSPTFRRSRRLTVSERRVIRSAIRVPRRIACF